MGAKKNCSTANSVPKMPTQIAAFSVLPVKCSISYGSTGMMMPMASTSSMMVTKMKTSAARRGADDISDEGTAKPAMVPHRLTHAGMTATPRWGERAAKWPPRAG